MTSNVKIRNNNFPVLVQTLDSGVVTNNEIVLVGDEIENRDWYITTTREVRFIDLENNDPKVVAEKEKRAAAETQAELPLAGDEAVVKVVEVVEEQPSLIEEVAPKPE